ncbi:helix-turn-helix domain-containing protein [Nocardiopsis composta]
MDAPSGIGERIARHRAHRGLTQEALAHSAGVSIDVVRRLEQGTRRTARLSTLASLARALDCDVATLLRPDASEPPRGTASVCTESDGSSPPRASFPGSPTSATTPPIHRTWPR